LMTLNSLAVLINESDDNSIEDIECKRRTSHLMTSQSAIRDLLVFYCIIFVILFSFFVVAMHDLLLRSYSRNFCSSTTVCALAS
jgi:hypothetical protein